MGYWSPPVCHVTPNSLSKEKGWNPENGQDLRIINEAVVPLHPTVPNPYVILGEIPPSAKWFTVLDLKDLKNLKDFFCIPLAKESQYPFAFEWEAPGEKHQ